MARSAPHSAQRYPLTIALGSDAGVRVARELSLHGGQLSAARLVKATALAPASVARALAGLVDVGLVEVAGCERSRLYRMRRQHRLSKPLVALFVSEGERFKEIMEAARTAAAKAGAVCLWLYGSVARGDDHTDSDLDLALVTQPGSRGLTGSDFRDALLRSAERLGFDPQVKTYTIQQVVELLDGGDPHMLALAAEATVLLGSSPEEIAREFRRGRSVAA